MSRAVWSYSSTGTTEGTPEHATVEMGNGPGPRAGAGLRRCGFSQFKGRRKNNFRFSLHRFDGVVPFGQGAVGCEPGLVATAPARKETQVEIATRRYRAVCAMAGLSCFLVLGCNDDSGNPTAPTTTDSAPMFQAGHSLTLQPGERYTVGTAVNVTLPAASGGNPPLTYRVSPSLPNGLVFNAGTRTITGTPTTEQSRREYAYTATDSDGDSATINFGITVVAARGTGPSSTCVVGQELRPGDSCTVGSDRFEVLSDGRGRYGCCITAGTGVNINRFVANRIGGTNNWRVERVP